MESKAILNLPGWLRTLGLAILLFALAGAGYLAWWYTTLGGRDGWVLLAMSIVQLSLTFLAVLVGLSFSERDVGSDALLRRGEDWFHKNLAGSLARLYVPLAGSPRGERGFETPCEVALEVSPSKLKANIRVAVKEMPALRLDMVVFLNVKVLSVFVAIPLTQPVNAANVKDHFTLTLQGAETIGWRTSVALYEQETHGVVPHAMLCLYVDVGDEFLTKPADRLYWAQDIALMVRSIFYRAHTLNADLRIERWSMR